MAASEVRSKDEHTSITGTEWLYLQLAATPYTVLKIALDTIKDWIMSDAMLDYLFPVGTVVPQFPAVASNTESEAFPVADRPATKYGGTWSEIFVGIDAFFKVGTTDHQPRTNGLSQDQMQRITGTFGRSPATGIPLTSSDVSGVFPLGTTVTQILSTASGTSYYVDFDSANSTSPTTASTGSVTEPRNYRMKIWKRTS